MEECKAVAVRDHLDVGDGRERNPNLPAHRRYRYIKASNRCVGNCGYKNLYIKESIQVATDILGELLPINAVVHHINHDPRDNRPENLVICQDQAYHNLLHRREKALQSCGHAHWRKCNYCGEYDDPAKMWVSENPKDGRAFHRKCANQKLKEWRHENGK